MSSHARWSREDKTKGICVTLPQSTIDALTEFLVENKFHSRSALIDKAIIEFISSKTTKEVSNG